VIRTTRSGQIAASIAVATAILVAAPVISIIALAMQPAPDVWQTLIEYVLPRSLLDTALLLIGVAVLSLAIGTGAAWMISLHEFRGRALLLWLVPLPLAIPTYLAAYVYVDLFEPLGLLDQALAVWLPLQDAVRVLPNLRSLPGAIIVIALVLYPYVYLSARTMFQFQSAEFSEAAKTLGAGRWTIFWRISLPMARPALAVGTALVSLETLNDIGASEYLGVRTLTVSVFTTWLNRGSLAGAAQLSCFMLAIVAGLIAIERYGRRNVTTEFSAESPRLTQRTTLAGMRGAGAFAVCLLPVLLGFLVPLLFLMQQSFKRGLFENFDMALWRDAFNSIAFASLATLTALLLGFATILAWRWRPTRLRFVAMNIAQTGYTLPGLVLALGLLTAARHRQCAERARRIARTIAAGIDPDRLGRAVVIAYDPLLAVPTDLSRQGSSGFPRLRRQRARPASPRHDDARSICRCCAPPCLAPSSWCSWIA
jgi:iron(III) transport system permease protein